MNRDTVLALLREHLPVLRERFGVEQLRQRLRPYVERDAIAV